ncbi:MAG: enoyl-CoA hydratase/isomerase family protein [Chloroflexi bacterium]|nr:enoyl-CoA hydratase/isomerase family protein [Chloroflexota bacterium]
MISSDVRNGIGVVSLDRPERRNALVPEQMEAFADEIRRLGACCRGLVITGAGPIFCPGADLKWLATLHDPALGVAELVAVHHQAILGLLDSPVPVVAAINGAVAGGGLGLALAADYRIAAEGASMAMAYFRLGLTPDGGSTAFLTRMIGPARTLELLLTNRRVPAQEALDLALVNEVVPDDELLMRSIAFAGSLPEVPGYTLLQTRKLLDLTGIRNQLQLESVAIRTAARQAQFRRALQAFVQRAQADAG